MISRVTSPVYSFLIKYKTGRFFLNKIFRMKFSSSSDYWEKRYAANGNSGTGSSGNLAIYKAGVINNFIAENNIQSVIEFGCGDGHQLKLLKIPGYTGLDVSATALKRCGELFKEDCTKKFLLYDSSVSTLQAEVSLSIDVIYHLLEDDVYGKYMQDLFSSAKKFVVIYSWNEEVPKFGHLRYRKFTTWIDEHIQNWRLQRIIKSDQPIPACDFFIYEPVLSFAD